MRWDPIGNTQGRSYTETPVRMTGCSPKNVWLSWKRQRVGVKVQWEACANADGSNALTDTYFSHKNSFLLQKGTDLPKGYGFMNPPYSKLSHFIDHWIYCKAQNPELGGLLALPFRPHSNWFRKIAHLKVVQFFHPGVQLFNQPGSNQIDRRPCAPCRWPVIVLIDEPRSVVVARNHKILQGPSLRVTAEELADRLTRPSPTPLGSVVANEQMHTMASMNAVTVTSWDTAPLTKIHDRTKDPPPPCMFEFPCHLSGARSRLAILPTAKVMLDSGCGVTHDGIINTAKVEELGLTVKPLAKPTHIQVGNGEHVTIGGTVEVHLRLQGVVTRITALVMNLLDGYDLILGQAWMVKHQVILNYLNRTATVRINSAKVVLKPPKQPVKGPDRSMVLLTSAQAKRLVRRGARHWLVLVTPALAEAVQMGQEDWIASLVEDYKDILVDDIPPGGCYNGPVPDVMPLEHDRPVFRSFGRPTPKERQEMHERVKYLLEKKMIQPSTSKYGAPVLFAEKPDGTLRMCINYKGINQITYRDRYPLPNMNDVLDQLKGAKHFSSMDMLNGFWQVPIPEHEMERTAFQTHEGSFEWRVLPMGLMNAPGVFQRVMNTVLRQHIDGKYCLVYIDDVIIYNKTEAEHQHHVRAVMQSIREAGMYLKKKKSFFNVQELRFLGQIVSGDGVRSNPEKTRALDEMGVPQTLKELQSFLGMCNWLSKFIPWFAQLVQSLVDLTKGGQKDITPKWTEEHTKIFNQVKEETKTRTQLQLPDEDKPYVVTTDASDTHIAMCLSQEHGPLAFASRRMSSAEQKMGAYDREAVAIHWAYTYWRHYLEGAKSTCYTDHFPLTYLLNQPTLSRRQARILIYLQSFEMDIQYLPGDTNPVDYLTRPSWIQSKDLDTAHYADLPEPAITAVIGRAGPRYAQERKHLRQRIRASLRQRYLFDHGVERTADGTTRLGRQSQSVAQWGTPARDLALVAAVEAAIRYRQYPRVPTQLVTCRDAQRYVLAAYTRAQRTRPRAPDIPTDLLPQPPATGPATVEEEEGPSIPTMDDPTPVSQAERDKIDLSNLEVGRWVEAYKKCPNLNRALRSNDARNTERTVLDTLVLRDNLYWFEAPAKQPTPRLVVPSEFIPLVLKVYHESKAAGHLGFLKTVSTIRAKFWWPGLKADVLKHCTECLSCQRNKPVRKRPLGELQPTEIPDAPWQHVTMDCVTALPLTAKGHDAILVMVDRFSKQVHIGACKKKSSAQDLMHIFNTKVVANHGMPLKVLTDRGLQFNNSLTNEFLQHMGVRQALTSAFHPQSDGQTEKTNQLIEEVLRHCRIQQRIRRGGMTISSWLSMLSTPMFMPAQGSLPTSW